MTMSNTSSNENVNSLEEQAVKRRMRLLGLKRKREGNFNNKSSAGENDAEILPKPLFRSYKPVDEKLHEHLLPEIIPEDVSGHVKDQLESAKSEVVIDQLDVTSLAPRKPDWDLKRDIAKKLDKLERQTQRAIAELIRDRLKERKETDLAAMVNAGTENSSND